VVFIIFFGLLNKVFNLLISRSSLAAPVISWS